MPVKVSIRPACRAAARSCPAPGSAGEACRQAAGRIGEEPAVHPVPMVFSGGVRRIIGQPADAEERAIQDGTGQAGSLPCGGVHGVADTAGPSTGGAMKTP
ncbi:hypothetical protein GCM10014719_43970 [Planomonospora parontospora subsp. antibiotica]|nr:hypothetical protein GCM10014719_43970 [Planomonospora parontospora subsp. antibiotica]GII17508.1 hypothetical protein Ppa05_42340 [Planomonospora parontospora subsp. antibiotica]